MTAHLTVIADMLTARHDLTLHRQNEDRSLVELRADHDNGTATVFRLTTGDAGVKAEAFDHEPWRARPGGMIALAGTPLSIAGETISAYVANFLAADGLERIGD